LTFFFFSSVRQGWVCPNQQYDNSKTFASCTEITNVLDTSWTKYESNNNNPSWNQVVYVPSPYTANYLVLNVYDSDSISDDELGTLSWRIDSDGTNLAGTLISPKASHSLTGKLSVTAAKQPGYMSFAMPAENTGAGAHATSAHLAPSSCAFPFTYKNIQYTRCITVDSPDEPWCSTDTVFDGNYLFCVKGAGTGESVSFEIYFSMNIFMIISNRILFAHFFFPFPPIKKTHRICSTLNCLFLKYVA